MASESVKLYLRQSDFPELIVFGASERRSVFRRCSIRATCSWPFLVVFGLLFVTLNVVTAIRAPVMDTWPAGLTMTAVFAAVIFLLTQVHARHIHRSLKAIVAARGLEGAVATADPVLVRRSLKPTRSTVVSDILKVVAILLLQTIV